MKEYRITYHESIAYYFYVSAKSKSDAEKKFLGMSSRGELDFSDGDVVNTEYTVEELNKKG